MELRDYLAVLRKYWVSIAAITLVGVVAAATFSLLTKPTFTARSAVFLSVRGGDTAGDLAQGATYATNQVRSYAQVATTPVVLQPVIDQLDLDITPARLAERYITVSIPLNTAIIEIAVDQTDPPLSARLAQGISEQLVRTVESLSPVDQAGNRTVIATIITPAAVPTEWTSPRVPLNLVIGLLVGLAVGIAQAALRNVLDLSVRTESDVARATNHSVIAKVPYDPTAEEHPLVMFADPHSMRAEAYRRLRTNLQFLDAGADQAIRSFVVTSSIADEGKSTTSINIATTLAEAGESVLLVDGDLRRPQIAKYLGLEDSAGLTTVLIGRAELPNVVQPVGRGGLHVLTAGQIPPNPAELLASTAMACLVEEAARRYDFVVVDAPPLLPVTDAAVISTLTSGAVVVAGASSVTVPELADALSALDQVGGTTLGIVLNKVRRADGGSAYGYHYHRRSPVEYSAPLTAGDLAEGTPSPTLGRRLAS